jgi:hypothetical protein
MKNSIANIIECVGPLCISDLRKNPITRSISGITERIMTKGKLKLTLKNLADALASKYPIPICPSMNEVLTPLKTKLPCADY